jgi:ATP-dependent helicase/nuclease subunit B
MGSQWRANVDAWLREGGVVVASSDRAARAFQAEFHRRRREEGLAAWSSPDIADWKTFARTGWQQRNVDGRLLLNHAQELTIWSEIVSSERHLPTALPASVRRLARMAMEAHDLICSYAPRLLSDEARAGWDRDAGAFSLWLSEFNKQCRNGGLISSSRVPLELITMLRAEGVTRPSVRLAGFDRILPVQREAFDAWGKWDLFGTDNVEALTEFHSVRDSQSELDACAFWCLRQVSDNPSIRILVVTQDQERKRGEIERAFLRFSSPGESPRFEF